MPIKINGLPENEPFECEDDDVQSFNPQGTEISFSDIFKSMLGKSNDRLNDLMKGIDPEDLSNIPGNESVEELLNLIENIGGMFGGEIPDNIKIQFKSEEPAPEEVEEDFEQKEKEYNANLERDLYDPKNYGVTPCAPVFSFVSEFQKYYGLSKKETTLTIDQIKNVREPEIILRDEKFLDLVRKINFIKINSTTKKFILLECYPDENTENFHPIILGAFKKPDGEFAFIFPDASNAFDRENNEFLNISEHPEMFDEGGFLVFGSLDDVAFDLDRLLFEEKQVRRRIRDVGVVRNIKASPTGNSDTLEIGKIKFNNTERGRFAAMDAGVSVDEEIPLYVKFSKIYKQEVLNIISNFFFKMNFLENERVNNEELHILSGKAYIEMDLGLLFEIESARPWMLE